MTEEVTENCGSENTLHRSLSDPLPLTAYTDAPLKSLAMGILHNRLKTREAIRDYLERQSQCNKLKDAKWQCVHCSDIPMQYNSYDCGVFICTYAHYLAANSPFKFNQGDMQNMRRHMVLELLSKALIL